MPESVNPEPASGTGLFKNLPSVNSLFKASWRRYAASLNVFAIIYVLYFAPLAIVVSIMSWVYQKMPKPMNPLVMAWLAAGGVMAALISVWGQAAFVYAATGKFQEIRKLLKEALDRTISFAWLYLLFILSIAAGLVFLVIPAIVALVWFSFAFYILALEGDRGMGALIKSRQYVRGRWWSVFGRLLPVWLLSFSFNLIPGLGPLLAMLFMPFSITYQCVLFEELRAAKGPVETPAPAKKRKWAVAGGSVIIIAMLMVGYGLSGFSRSQLEQMAKDPVSAIQNVISASPSK